jgi:adenylate kinase
LKEKHRLDKLADDRFSKIEKHVQEVSKSQGMNHREFLMKNIVPILTEGMLDCVKVAPIDPIDYLAEYMFKRSNDFNH